MRVDLLIETDAPSTLPWQAMARSMNQQARDQHLALGLLLSAQTRNGDGAGHETGCEIHLAVATVAAEIKAVMPRVLGSICEAGRAGALRIEAVPGGLLGRVAPALPTPASQTVQLQLMQAFRECSAEAIAAALALETEDRVETADQVRSLFERATGRELPGLIRRERMRGTAGYVLAAASGRLVAFPSPVGRGWIVVEDLAHGRTGRVWTTAARYADLGLLLQLDLYLDDLAHPLDARFRHAEIDTGSGIERKHYGSTLGPLVVHTREHGADRSQLQVVIEIPVHRQIRNHLLRRGTLPQGHELLASVPF